MKKTGKGTVPVFYNIFMNCADFRCTGSAPLTFAIACGRQHAYLEQNLCRDYRGYRYFKRSWRCHHGLGGKEPPYLENSDILACVPQFREILQHL